MKFMTTPIIVFWSISVFLIGSGQPSIERWWVPALAILVSIGQLKHPVQVPRPHRPWFIAFLLWWCLLLVPIPDSILPLLQSGLGDYRLLLFHELDIGLSTIALKPSIHLYSGATIILLYILYLQMSIREVSFERPIVHTILFFAGIGLLQYLMDVQSIFGILPVPSERRSPFFGSFINGNHAAYFMACGLFLVHSVYKGIKQFCCQLLLIICIFLCESRGAAILAMISLIWLYVPKHRLISILSSSSSFKQ